MRPDRQLLRPSSRASAVALCLLACVTPLGCATPPGQSWADFRSRRKIEELASDTSFPTAAEVGLNTTDEISSGGS